MLRQCDTCRFGGATQKGCMARTGVPRYMPEDGCPLYAMSAQAFLLRVRGAQRRIVYMEEQAARYRDMATRTTARMDGICSRTGFAHSGTEENMNALMDVSQEIGREAQRLRGYLAETHSVLALMRSPQERELIELRYLSEMSWQDIADRMFMCERTVRRLHAKAMENMQLAMDALEYSRCRPGWNPQGGAAAGAAAVRVQ
jgi:RNA polymerase sigma factor (sigma-70 family)